MSKSLLGKSLLRAIALLAVCATSADAVVTTFTDRLLWEAAVGPRDFEEDFEGFLSDIDFSSTTTSAPDGFSLSHSGNDPFRNLIDVSPLSFTDGNGTAGVSAYVDGDGGAEITITPDFDLSAFGLEVSSAATGELATISTIGPGGTSLITIQLTNGIDDFFGFRATGGDRIVSLTIEGLGDGGSGGEGFYMDNFAGVFAVPEISTFALAMVGLAAAGLQRRRSQ